MATERWSSRLGFLLATVGAAVGLGNIWRFSAVVGTNGGGAYLVPYLLAAAVCAVPLLVLELAIGRRFRTDVVSAFRSVDPAYTAFGWLVAGGVLLVLSYYLVLTGWVLGFLISWLAGSATTFAAFTAGWLPVGYFVVATALTAGVVSLGVRDGIERMANVVMPTVFVVLVALAVYAMTLPAWDRAVAFLFTPRFAVLGDLGLWSAAFGQVFFSLSVGQGIMLTYGSYVDEETDLLASSLLITVADVGAAVVAGLVIFPIVFSFGLQPTLGTELAFTTLPTAFATMPFGRVVAVAFFGLLFFAALSSAVSLLEVGVAAATNTTRLSRPRATLALTVGVFVAGVPSALSYSPSTSPSPAAPFSTSSTNPSGRSRSRSPRSSWWSPSCGSPTSTPSARNSGRSIRSSAISPPPCWASSPPPRRAASPAPPGDSSSIAREAARPECSWPPSSCSGSRRSGGPSVTDSPTRRGVGDGDRSSALPVRSIGRRGAADQASFVGGSPARCQIVSSGGIERISASVRRFQWMPDGFCRSPSTRTVRVGVTT
ncbi:sodium-dependent transporter [Haloplanus sp. GCM10025708]|uniref:sodium-dependent transporter n=1 Tax=Haloplanus sp. GCM10025708 TaxID=3252679 RepID=UPI0036087833